MANRYRTQDHDGPRDWRGGDDDTAWRTDDRHRHEARDWRNDERPRRAEWGGRDDEQRRWGQGRTDDRDYGQSYRSQGRFQDSNRDSQNWGSQGARHGAGDGYARGYGTERGAYGSDRGGWSQGYAPGGQIWQERNAYGSGSSASGREDYDPDYLHWRQQQLSRFDKDYDAWRNERRTQFSSDFDAWRAGRADNPTVGDVTDGEPGASSDKRR